MKITKQQIENGLRDYQYYLNGRAGHFYTALFDAMQCADYINLVMLAQVYPSLVYAYAESTGKLKHVKFEEV